MSIRHISYIYERRFLSLTVHTPWFVNPACSGAARRGDGSSSSGAVAAAAAVVVVSTAIVPTAAVISAKTEASRDSKDSP